MKAAELKAMNKDDLLKLVGDLQKENTDLNKAVDLRKLETGPKSHTIQFRMTQGKYERLEVFCKGNKCTPNQMAEDKLDKFLGYAEKYRSHTY